MIEGQGSKHKSTKRKRTQIDNVSPTSLDLKDTGRYELHVKPVLAGGRDDSLNKIDLI